MRAPRPVLLAATAVLLAACTGCIGASSPVAPAPQRDPSHVAPYVDPDAQIGTLEGELRRGTPLPADEEGLDPTRPWADVAVDILDASGQPAAATASDAKGQFRVSLPPGDYRVVPRWPVTRLHRFAPAPPEAGVRVADGATSFVRLVYDPGTL